MLLLLEARITLRNLLLQIQDSHFSKLDLEAIGTTIVYSHKNHTREEKDEASKAFILILNGHLL